MSISEILASVAEAEAAKIAVPMAIAIVDGEGGLQLFQRMDGTLPVSTELAVSKAYTAAILRMPTHQVGELAQPGQALYGIQHTHNGRIVLFGGGYPLVLRKKWSPASASAVAPSSRTCGWLNRPCRCLRISSAGRKK